MNRQFRRRFWLETGLAAVTGLLCLITPVWPDWIEALSGWDPDKHDGSVEWMIAVAFLVVTIGMLVVARREWRRTPVIQQP